MCLPIPACNTQKSGVQNLSLPKFSLPKFRRYEVRWFIDVYQFCIVSTTSVRPFPEPFRPNLNVFVEKWFYILGLKWNKFTL